VPRSDNFRLERLFITGLGPPYHLPLHFGQSKEIDHVPQSPFRVEGLAGKYVDGGEAAVVKRVYGDVRLVYYGEACPPGVLGDPSNDDGVRQQMHVYLLWEFVEELHQSFTPQPVLHGAVDDYVCAYHNLAR